MKKILGYFSKFEWCLLVGSLATILIAHLASGNREYIKLIASLIGTTALMFNAKGNLIGQILIIIFGCLYGYISYQFRYYGEIISYMGMSVPMSVIALVSWFRHPYKGKKTEVEIGHLKKIDYLIASILTLAITAAFYFILRALGTTNLIPSTISIATSFAAAYLSFKRSPYYALGYVANDLVLIVLWVMATIKDISYLSVVICFVVFLLNDLYGFFSWNFRYHRQNTDKVSVYYDELNNITK